MLIARSLKISPMVPEERAFHLSSVNSDLKINMLWTTRRVKVIMSIAM